MRIIGVIGIVLSVVFALSLGFALASEGSVSIGEYAVVACAFDAFAIGLGLAGLRARSRPKIATGVVLSLAIVYLACYALAFGETSRITGNQLHMPVGASLAAAVFMLSVSLARRPRSLSDAVRGSSAMVNTVTTGSPAAPDGARGVGTAAKWMG